MARRARGKSRAARAERDGAGLPAPIAAWFEGRGWTPRAHQLRLIEKSREKRDTLLIAPTGAGKTLAGFLPSLIDLTEPENVEP